MSSELMVPAENAAVEVVNHGLALATSVRFETDDIVSIGVVGYERAVETAEQELKEARRKVSGAIAETRRRLEAVLAAELRAAREKVLDDVIAAMVTLGVRSPKRDRAGLGSALSASRIELDESPDQATSDRTVHYVVRFSWTDTGDNFGVDISYRTQPVAETAEARRLRLSVNELSESCVQLDKEIARHMALRDASALARVSRRLRASVASAQLHRTSEGENLLRGLDTDGQALLVAAATARQNLIAQAMSRLPQDDTGSAAGSVSGSKSKKPRKRVK